MLSASYPATDPRHEKAAPAQRAKASISWIAIGVTALASLLLGVLLSNVYRLADERDVPLVAAPSEAAPELPVPSVDERVADEPSVEEVLRNLASAGAADTVNHSELASPEEKIRLLEEALESYRGVILYQQDEIRRLRVRVDQLEHR